MKVLLLEDDETLAGFLSRLLAEESLAVDVCRSGLDAMNHARGRLYDLLILDWGVPDADGLTVCRELRRSGVTTPILMLTARADTRERVLGLDAGADDYMVKPFEVDELVARVRALLRRASRSHGRSTPTTTNPRAGPRSYRCTSNGPEAIPSSKRTRR